MKVCNTCGETKKNIEFSKRKSSGDGMQSSCKLCKKAAFKVWYEQNKDSHIKSVSSNTKARSLTNRKQLWKYLDDKACVDCGETDPVVLDFDHVRGKKRHNVSLMAHAGYAWDTILKEIAKCDIRCSNCHRKRTTKQFNYHAWRTD